MMYLLLFSAFFVLLAVYCATIMVIAFIDALCVARWYYRTHPDAVPPDRPLVRLGLLGVPYRREEA